MFKICLTLSIFMIASTSLNYGSDSLEDVKSSYDQAMKRAKETENKETSPRNNTQKLNYATKEEKLLNVIEALTEMPGVDASTVTTQEQLLKKNEAFNTKLYHALNASICHISDYLNWAQNDHSLEWTQQHTYCFAAPGLRCPIDGYTYHSTTDEGGRHTVAVLQNSQIYEIQRQKLCLEFTFFWDMLVFWKKSIFPNDNIQSYSFYSAHALKDQISDQLNKRKEGVKTMPIDREITDLDHYPLAIIDMLENINNALPVEIQHIIKLNKGFCSQDITLKIERNKRLINQKKVIYDMTYQEFFSKYMNLNRCIIMLISNPFEVKNNPYFPSNFKILYKEFLKHRFPSIKGNIKFFHPPLNFEKLMGEITNTTFEEENEPSTNESTQTTTPDTIGKDNDEEEPETIIYDQAYWEAEHKTHLERKVAASLNVNYPQIQVSDYEENLHTFLRERVYAYTKIKARKLKQELKDLKFKVIANNAGNGSLHYVMPTVDNPLFGTNENYVGAYFNVHLPNDGVIIPNAYFDYIKSGFANVFGLKF